MADETPYSSFTAALDSIRDIVRNELVLIELDGELKAKLEKLSDEDRQTFVDDEKESFLRSIRGSLETVISDIATDRGDEWDRVKGKRGENLKNLAENMEFAPGVDGGNRCPPGFVEVDGICVPI